MRKLLFIVILSSIASGCYGRYIVTGYEYKNIDDNSKWKPIPTTRKQIRWNQAEAFEFSADDYYVKINITGIWSSYDLNGILLPVPIFPFKKSSDYITIQHKTKSLKGGKKLVLGEVTIVLDNNKILVPIEPENRYYQLWTDGTFFYKTPDYSPGTIKIKFNKSTVNNRLFHIPTLVLTLDSNRCFGLLDSPCG